MAVVSTVMLISGLSSRRELRAFVGSNGLLVGLLATGAGAIFPVMLYSTLAPESSLTAYAVAASPRALHIASIWWPLGFVLATIYFVFISLRYAGKVSVKRDTQGFY
jgi:cytochrome bd-type quinol oxidase subunit 2